MVDGAQPNDRGFSSTSGPRRYLILLAAVMMQTCLGATYAWSVFVHYLRETTGVGQGTAQLAFTVFYAVFPATMILSGTLLKRFGLRGCAMIGGLVFGSGWMVASLGRFHLGWTVAGVGLIGGIGVGMAYIVPIATCVLWFPRHKGLVTGISVAGFGGGAAVVTRIAEHLIANRDYSVFSTFATLGVGFAVLVSLAGSIMRYPANHEPQAALSQPAREFLATRFFWLLYLAMFAGLAAGFTVNANLKQLSPATTGAVGATAVALFALANAAGRIGWGLLFDRIGAPFCIRANLLAQAAMLAASPLLLRSPEGLPLIAVWCGFNYGGVLVLYASSAAATWGPQRLGQVYGWLFSANIPAALAPLLAGLAFDATGSFTAPLLTLGTLLVVVVAAAAAMQMQFRPYASGTAK